MSWELIQQIGSFAAIAVPPVLFVIFALLCRHFVIRKDCKEKRNCMGENFKALEATVSEHDQEIKLLKQAIKELPKSEEFTQMRISAAETKVEISAIHRLIAGISDQFNTLDHYLRENTK